MLTKLTAIASVSFLALAVSSCGAGPGPEGANGQSERQAGQFLTGSSGGVYDILGGGIAQLINDEVETLQVNASTPPNVGVVPGQIGSGQAMFGFMQVDQYDRAQAGEGEFTEPVENMKHISGLYTNVSAQVALESSGIDSTEDLGGKRVAVTSESTKSLIAGIAELSGVPEDEVTWVYLTYAESAAALKDGDVDVAFFTAAPKNGTLEDLSSTENLNFLTVPDGVEEEWAEQNPKNKFGEVPADTYRGQTEAVRYLAVYPALVTNGDLTEENAYSVTKTLMENPDALSAAHPAGSEITPETMQTYLDEGFIDPADLHPGAHRYFEEAGLDF